MRNRNIPIRMEQVPLGLISLTRAIEPLRELDENIFYKTATSEQKTEFPLRDYKNRNQTYETLTRIGIQDIGHPIHSKALTKNEDSSYC